MKLLCSDYDGTLRFADGIRAADIEAINRFRAAGHKFAIVTGRTWCVIIDELRRWKVPYDYLVCNNGAALIEGDRFLCRFIDSQAACEIADFYKTARADYYGLSNGVDISLTRCRPQTDFYAELSRPVIPEQQMLADEKVCGFYSVFSAAHDAVYAAEQLRAQFGDYIEVLPSSDLSIDITPKGVNKSNGVRHLIKKHQISDVYAIGDSPNDLGMLEAFDSFAIASGSRLVREVCGRVVNHLDECIADLLSE